VKASVVIPINELHGARLDNWQYVQARWRAEYLQWPIINGWCPDPWRKAVAMINGAHAAPYSPLIISDADVWTPGIEEAVQMSLDLDTWVKPHHRLIRLNQRATEAALAGEDLSTFRDNPDAWEEKPYRQTPTGAVVIMPKRILNDTPPDPRFVGWGGQDYSWGLMLETLHGRPASPHLITYHLWHPPPPRLNRHAGSHENEALKKRYKAAHKNPQVMRALIEEGQHEWAQAHE
jgi:hypothetical protein